MANGIDIKIGTLFDKSGVTEANKGLANLSSVVRSESEAMQKATLEAARGMGVAYNGIEEDLKKMGAAARQAALRSAAEIESFAAKADRACKAMGGGYKTLEQQLKELETAHKTVGTTVSSAARKEETFADVLKRAAAEVDKRTRNERQAVEVRKALATAQEKLARITNAESSAYKTASRNVEILKTALTQLGGKTDALAKPTTSFAKSFGASISGAATRFKSFASSIGRNLVNIQAGFHLAARALRTFTAALSKGMEFERMTVQFKSLTGSMELARQHMRDLQDLGRTPPFSLEQFAAASQAMMKMTGGMAGFKEQMQIVGDMAVATGNDIATVGRAFGLAYQVIRDGQDFGRAGQMLYTLGIMTKAQVAEFAELSKAGTDNRAVWERLTEVFGRYKGAMAETEKTTKGMVEAIQGEATVAMTEFSAAIADEANPALEGLLGYLKRINEDGTIEDWADDTVAKLNEVGKVAKTVGDVFGWFWKAAKTVGASVTGFRQGAKMADELGLTGDEKWAYARKFRSDVIDEIWGTNQEANEEKQDNRERRRAAKAKKRAEESAKAEAEAKRRIEEDFARAQQKRDEEKRKKDLDEYTKSGSTDTFDEWRKAKIEADAEKLKKDKEAFAEFQRKSGVDASAQAANVGEFDEAFVAWRKAEETRRAEEQKTTDAKLTAERKAEAELHAQRLSDAKAEATERIKAQQAAANAQQTIAQRAQTEFDRAFAMYRDPEQAAAQIAEERDYAADYKQLQKDASRYGGKWRIDELSRLMAAGDTQGQAATLEEWRKSSRFTPEVEAMVRAAAADKTKTTAEDELRKISANTQGLSQKLDELLKMKG